MSEAKTKTEVAPVHKREFAQVASHVPVFDTAKFEHICRVAQAIAAAPMLPEHLKAPTERETVGNCVLIVSKALAWNMDPFDVAMATSVVHGKLCYEGKLIAAMLEGNHGVRLRYEWNEKTGDAFGIKVFGKRPGEEAEVSIEGTVGDWKTFTKPKQGSNAQPRVQKQWEGSNARRQLAYRGAREWARIFMPAAIIGIYAPDEIEPDDHAQPRSPRRSPMISASFADEVEQPARDISAEVIEAEVIDPPAEEAEPEEQEQPEDTGEDAAPDEPEAEEAGLDLSEGEEHEDSPFDPRPDGEDDEGELESEAHAAEDTGEPDFGDEEQPGEDNAIADELLDAFMAAGTFDKARAAILDITKSEVFRKASPEAKDHARRRLYNMLLEKPEPLLESEDPVVFRLWVPVCDDASELEDTFAQLEQSARYKALKEVGRTTLIEAVSLRIAEIEGIG